MIDQEAVLAALRDELTCELCEGLFKDPHLFSGCGHTFCYNCIIKRIEGPGIKTSQCPKCKQPGWKRDLKPVHVLANIAQPICNLLDEAGVPGSEGVQKSTERLRLTPASASKRGRGGKLQGSAQKVTAAGKQKGSAAAGVSKKGRVEKVQGSAQKAAAASKQTDSAAAKAESGSRLSVKKRASGGRKKVTFAAGSPAHKKAAQASAPGHALATPAERKAEHAHAAKEQHAAPAGAAFKSAVHRAGNTDAAAEKGLIPTGAAPEVVQLPHKPSLVPDTYQELSQPLHGFDAGGHISSSSEHESVSAAGVHTVETGSRHSHASKAAGGKAMLEHADSKHGNVNAAELPAAGAAISRPHASNAAAGLRQAPQKHAGATRAPKWLEESQPPDSMAPPVRPFIRANSKRASAPAPQEGATARNADDIAQGASAKADFTSDCEAGNGVSRLRFKKAKTEHCKGPTKTVPTEAPKQGPQQPSRERPTATAPRKAGQSTGPARGQTFQKQTAGRCQTRQHRAANDKFFVQQFTSEMRAVLDNASLAGPQPADSNAEARAGKKARVEPGRASREESEPAVSDAGAPAGRKALGSRACTALGAALAAEGEPGHSNDAAPAVSEARGNKDSKAHRDEAAGAPHASKSECTQGIAIEVDTIPETPGAARRATRSASTVADPAMQEEQSALQSPASMDTDRRAGKAAEHSPSMQSVKQGKALEELTEEDAGQMHSAVQEQVAQALPEQVNGQQFSSAVQEQAEEGLPAQAAELTPSVKAEALPEKSTWQTPSSAVQEQSGEGLPEQPSEQTPPTAVAEAQPLEDTTSMHRPAGVTGVTSLSEQGVRATSSVAGEALPVQAIEQTPLTSTEAPFIGDTPSIPRQEHGTASIAPPEQPAGHVPPLAAAAQETPSRHSAERGAASISGTEQGTGKALAMTVGEVNALGQELCAKAAQFFPRTQEEAEALRAATRAMCNMLQRFGKQAPVLIAEPCNSQPLGVEVQHQGLQTGLEQQRDNGVHVDESLPYPMSTAKSLSAIDAALIAKGIRFQSLDVTS